MKNVAVRLKKTILILVLFLVGISVSYVFLLSKNAYHISSFIPNTISKIPGLFSFGQKQTSNSPPKQSVVPVSTSKPAPKILTFSELNNLYGPCVHLPVLFYHHIEDPVLAKA